MLALTTMLTRERGCEYYSKVKEAKVSKKEKKGERKGDDRRNLLSLETGKESIRVFFGNSHGYY